MARDIAQVEGGAANAPVELAAETNVEDILATIAEGKRPDLRIAPLKG